MFIATISGTVLISFLFIQEGKFGQGQQKYALRPTEMPVPKQVQESYPKEWDLSLETSLLTPSILGHIFTMSFGCD